MAGSRPHSKRGPSTQPTCLKVMLDRKNEVVHMADILKATSLNRDQIQGAMARLIARHAGMVVVHAGNAWRYNPDADEAETAEPAPPAKHVYEQVGVAYNGDHVIEDESGKLYRAVPL